MKPWLKIKRAIDAIENFINHIGHAIAISVEIIGAGINITTNRIGDTVKIKPVLCWFGSIFKNIFSLIGCLIRSTFGFVAGIIGGIVKIISGPFTWEGKLMLEGIGDIISPIVGTIIVLLGNLIALVQSFFHLQDFERPLTKQEKRALKTIFNNSVSYPVTGIIEGHAGLFGLSSRAFTLGNTIYLKTHNFKIDLIVHETTHAWQYQQTNCRYASDAVAAQWFFDDAYNWQKEINNHYKTKWIDFNNEAQARFLQDIWKHGKLKDKDGITIQSGNGSFFQADEQVMFGHFSKHSTDYTAMAKDAVKSIRKKWF